MKSHCMHLTIIPLLLMLAAQQALCDATTNASPNTWAVAYSTGMAEVSRKVLVALHANKTNDAIQFLEENLDFAVILMASRLNKEPNYRGTIESTLRGVASYRATYRRPSASLYGSDEDRASMDEAAEAAKRILEKYRSTGQDTTNTVSGHVKTMLGPAEKSSPSEAGKRTAGER